MPAGRPSDYNTEIAAEICSRIARGEALTRICRDEHMPCVLTVSRWRLAHPEFSTEYARAREDQADTYADEIVEISDKATNDWMDRNDPDNPGYDLNGENIQRSRLRVDARKWVASKLKPRKYGDSATMALTGADGGPVQSLVEVGFVSGKKNPG